MPRDTLTPQQAKFVEEYLTNGRNAAAAYRIAYPGNASAKVIWNEASRLLANPGVAMRIEEADAASAKAMNDRIAISKEAIAARLALIAFGNAEKLQVQSVAMPEQRKALEALARLQGYVIEKRDVRVVKSIRDLSDDELQAIVAEGQRDLADEETRH